MFLVIWSKKLFYGSEMIIFGHLGQKAVSMVSNDIFWSFRPKSSYGSKMNFFAHLGQKAVLWVKNDAFWLYRGQ